MLLMTEATPGHVPKAEQLRLDGGYESVKKMLAKLYGAVSRKPLAVPTARRTDV